jgi:hypothetical protein
MISFTMDSAVNVINDEEIANIQAAAAAAALRGVPMPKFKCIKGTTQMQRMLAALRHVVWCDAYDRAQIKKAAG